jgi:hypothetical protein
VLLAGCDASSAGAGGTLDVRLTGAPGDTEQAIVTIERVAAVPAEGTADGEAMHAMAASKC